MLKRSRHVLIFFKQVHRRTRFPLLSNVYPIVVFAVHYFILITFFFFFLVGHLYRSTLLLSLFLFRTQSVALLYPSVLVYLMLRPRNHVNGETPQSITINNNISSLFHPRENTASPCYQKCYSYQQIICLSSQSFSNNVHQWVR